MIEISLAAFAPADVFEASLSNSKLEDWISEIDVYFRDRRIFPKMTYFSDFSDLMFSDASFPAWMSMMAGMMGWMVRHIFADVLLQEWSRYNYPARPMNVPRLSASSYSNTAPLVWSFLYGKDHGKVELILDNAPARSVELLEQDRVDAALVPVIASQVIEGVRIIPDVCVGAREKVRSVSLITKGVELENVRSVALDTSSKTSVVLTKIIFREFLGFEPAWRDAAPDIDAMLAASDAALLIGDPALSIAECGMRNADLSEPGAIATGFLGSEIRDPRSVIRKFDLAELWHKHTGLGFVFAMWMTRRDRLGIDLATARDEGLRHIDDIAANYASDIGLSVVEMTEYLSENISYSFDQSMQKGMDLFLDLAARHGLIAERRKLNYL